MKVYIASWYASRDDMRKHRDQLQALNIEVTSRWLEEDSKLTSTTEESDAAFLRQTAVVDIYDIMRANVLILNTPTEEDLKIDMPISNWARGGRHFETGLHYALMLLAKGSSLTFHGVNWREVIIVGRCENVFHQLNNNDIGWPTESGHRIPCMIHVPTWDEAINKLKTWKEYDHNSANTPVNN